MASLTIHTDGGSRGNPGPAGIGVVVTDQVGQVVYETSQFLGEKTNNEAEYLGFITSLEWLVDHTDQIEKVTWKLDSKLVVEQLNKNWKIKEPRMRELAQQAWKLLEKIPNIQIQIVHVKRAFNKDADALVNQALDAALA